jgi:BirA family transcriptional regulator, biotin operon repressor / biotin---[acetyl-CoA-carboxylase] ligase
VTSVLKFNLHHFPVLESTQTYTRQHLDQFRHGDVVVADRQSAGLGQYGRSWHSPGAGNIYLTMVLETGKKIPEIPEITQVAALAICRLLKIYCLKGRVKLPNDVLVDGKKIAGILGTFVPGFGEVPAALLLGIGINVNMPAAELGKIELPATSFSVLLGKDQPAEEILQDFLSLFGEYCQKYAAEGLAPFNNLSREFGLLP